MNLQLKLDFSASPDQTSSTTTTEQPAREMDIEEIIEQSKDFKCTHDSNVSKIPFIILIADGLTSHGELCTDECARRGYPYYWCHKASSNLGQWWDSDFCSPSPNMTHYGKVMHTIATMGLLLQYHSVYF